MAENEQPTGERFNPPPPPEDIVTSRYTNMGEISQPMYVVRGLILTGFQSLGYYDVSTDYGRVFALAGGTSGGELGARGTGLYMPGDQVAVAVNPLSPGMNAIVLGRIPGYEKNASYEEVYNKTVYPQVAGFEYGERFSGKAYSSFPRLRNFNSGLADAVDGEWVQHNMFGGAVGVELFRTFLQGGPFCGVYCYTEDQHLKLVGARIERVTVGGSDEQGAIGATTAELVKRYFYPSDQMSGYQAQLIRAAGVGYLGSYEILTYPDGLNGSDSRVIGTTESVTEEVENEDGELEEVTTEEPKTTESRVALIHEHKGADGNYSLTAAGSIFLQKSVEIPVLVDVIEAESYTPEEATTEEEAPEDAESTEGECPCGDELTPDPEPPARANCPDDEDEDGETEAEEGSCESSQFLNVVNNESNNPLAFAINARGLADQFVHAAISSLLSTCRWQLPEKPVAVYGETTSSENLFSKSPGMWKCMPKTFKLALTPDGDAKRFYFGRAMIAILEDGSIVMQDAQGSQFMMSGGNIAMSCTHDIVRTAGRNLLDVAGRDYGIRAGRHLDLFANEGRLTAMAAQTLSAVGGTSGSGGLHLESQGEYGGVLDTGGEIPALSGGVVLKSKQLVTVASQNVHVKAGASGWSAQGGETGSVVISAADSVMLEAVNPGSKMVFGRELACSFPVTNILLGGYTSLIEGHLATRSIQYDRRYARTVRKLSADDPRYVNNRDASYQRNTTTNQQVSDAFENFYRSVLNPATVSNTYTAKYMTSKQYNLRSDKYFTIPEPEWQQRARGRYEESSAALKATMQDQQVEGTSPFPGSGAWSGYGMATVDYTAPDFGEAPSISFSVSTTGLDGGLYKGI